MMPVLTRDFVEEQSKSQKDMMKWKTRFAFLPTRIEYDEETGVEKSVLFGFYQFRKYCTKKENPGYIPTYTWWEEYRLPGAEKTYKREQIPDTL